jgi:hemerythrin-like domain-containing protein
MKRHKSLHALSRHHHFALMEALYMRRALKEPVERRAMRLKKVAEKFVQFWEQKGKLHFRNEEEILLPAYAVHVSLENDPDVIRMLADHALIRAKAAVLSDLLSKDEPVEAVLAELGTILQNHVRLEEDIIFPRFEKTLSESELEQLGQLFPELHSKQSCER